MGENIYLKTFEKLEKIPRVKLAFLPSPLQKLERISQLYGVEMYMKRDDLTGVEFGGNKTRKLEFTLPEAVKKKAKYLVTGAAFQSNWCRQTIACGNRLGMKTVLFLYGSEIPQKYKGNLLLDKVMGAEIHLNKLQQGESIPKAMQRTKEKVDERIKELEEKDGKCYYIEVGAPFPRGHVAYVYAVGELLRQLKEKGMMLDYFDYIVTAIGTGGTYTGLLVGKKLFNSTVKIYGFSAGFMPIEILKKRILKGAEETAEFLKVTMPFSKEDIYISEDYVGKGYDIPSKEEVEAIKHIAQNEAIFLDPVYTGKAMAGLLDFIKIGRIPKGSKVLFWHTGGLPALFSGEEITGSIYEL